jgi:hypothetical protein
MKQLLSLFLFLLPCLAWAQYPSNGNQKITLGEQTTADGLIWRGLAADTTLTAKSDTAAYFVLDTVNLNLYTYKASATGRKWRQLGADTAAIAYVNTYGTQTVNGLKTFTDTMRIEDAIKVGANNAYVYSAGTGNYYFTKDFKNQSGNHFIIIGDGTMSNATTVSNPTSSRVGGVAIGYNVMKNLSQSASTNNGVYNSGVGYGALESVTTGGFNTAFGHISLNKLTTGISNAGLGTSTLENSTDGERNLAIGNGALRFITTGNDNVGIGSNAGIFSAVGGSQVTSLNNSIYIGSRADPSATTGVTNEIAIGKDAKGQGSNSVTFGNTSTTKTILNGNVGIGQTTPTAVLHLKAGTATASTAPLKFNSQGASLLNPVEPGAVEFDGTNLLFTPSATRHTVNHGLTGSATLNFPSTLTMLSADLTITVTGAADGDVVSLGVPNAAVNANTSYSAWVSAANTVTVRFNNYSSGTVDPASALFKVFVTK